eukprot:CAMPEP_0172497068 /NCGR_PEP_ID=MMETSP1066-20121228/94780_1 /TAXON_ID=671091 /ORGANISM="Coscinodiscus wailesii, Strain CCMP2513" /LENGTH=725 /DNA_ID=CAMNT_0013269645 /DNA_START=26 /DNA_END=2200 /DNA_ORIENTATION=-
MSPFLPAPRPLSPALLLLLLLLTTSTVITGQTLNEPFQSEFNDLTHIPCVSLYTRNGRVGCGTSTRSTQSGRLLHYSATTGPADSYVSVIPGLEFTAETLEAVLTGDKYTTLAGVLVVNVTTTDDGSSGDDSSSSSGGVTIPSPAAAYPRGEDTPESQLTPVSYPWNGAGDSLLYKDVHGTPIVWIPDGEMSRYILSESRRQLSQPDPAISAQFNYYMGPQGETSQRCLEWKDQDEVWRPKCLPLGGNSVWATTRAANGDGDGGDGKEVVMLGTGIDATSMFHDASTGANTAASGIMSLLLAAQIVGELALDGLSKSIGFGFFQGENYGYLGSRRFLKDIAGFECLVSASRRNITGCIYPVRPSLEFQNVAIDSFVAVDQIGVLATDKTAYVHATDDFVSNVMLALGEDDFAVAKSSAEGEDGNTPIPPSPLTSLMSISGNNNEDNGNGNNDDDNNNNIAGAVLTGYDNAFVSNTAYLSHYDRASYISINIDAIVSSAILLARTAVALAYDNGDEDYETAVNYATNLIADNVITSSTEIVTTLYNCLFEDGNCQLITNYTNMERANNYKTTGVDMGSPAALGNPPNYYVSIFDIWNGLPVAQVNGRTYGAYNGTDFDEKRGDGILIKPAALEMFILGWLNDALGKIQNGNNNADTSISCQSTVDCDAITSCRAVCAGQGQCVCSHANYHVAFDEAIEPKLNYTPGYYQISEDDAGITPIYTEPYW